MSGPEPPAGGDARPGESSSNEVTREILCRGTGLQDSWICFQPQWDPLFAEVLDTGYVRANNGPPVNDCSRLLARLFSGSSGLVSGAHRRCVPQEVSCRRNRASGLIRPQKIVAAWRTSARQLPQVIQEAAAVLEEELAAGLVAARKVSRRLKDEQRFEKEDFAEALKRFHSTGQELIEIAPSTDERLAFGCQPRSFRSGFSMMLKARLTSSSI